jgi:hypothetical protein
MKKNKECKKSTPRLNLTEDEKDLLNRKLVNDAVYVGKAIYTEREMAWLNRNK